MRPQGVSHHVGNVKTVLLDVGLDANKAASEVLRKHAETVVERSYVRQVRVLPAPLKLRGELEYAAPDLFAAKMRLQAPKRARAVLDVEIEVEDGAVPSDPFAVGGDREQRGLNDVAENRTDLSLK